MALTNKARADAQASPSHRTVALLDVDRTLIGNAAFDYKLPESKENFKQEFNAQVERVKDQMLKEDTRGQTSSTKRQGVLNKDLLIALEGYKIRDVYLFTAMSLSSREILERAALCAALKELGFKVHGIIIPSEVVHHMTPESVAQYNTQITDAKDEEKAKETLKNIALATSVTQLGVPFQQAKDALESQVEGGNLAARAEAGLSLAARLAESEGLPNVKGKMFEHFLNYNNQLPEQNRFTHCVVADDLGAVIQSAHLVNSKAKNPVQLSTVYVAKYRNKNPLDENQVHYCDILRLQNACLEYENYLQQKIHTAKNKNSLEIKLAREKLAAIQEVRAAVPDEKTQYIDSHLDVLEKALNKHRNTIKARRDTCGMTLLKVAATIFSCSIAFWAGMWKVRGKDLVKEFDSVLTQRSTQKAGM